MARTEENQPFTSTYSEAHQGGGGNVDMVDDLASPSGSGCCCFGFGFGLKSNQESRSLLQQNNNNSNGDVESWFVNKLKKLKEFSELVAGPKWKNFIRKIGKYAKSKKYPTKTQCMYSPQSYALNFADAADGEEEDDDMFVTFSSRFSAPLSTDKQRTAAAATTTTNASTSS